MKKTEKKKLTLSRETVAALEDSKLAEAAGQGPSTSFSQCFTWCNACQDQK